MTLHPCRLHLYKKRQLQDPAYPPNAQALCESIRAELENDRLIAETGVLPSVVDLPAVTAPEYCQVSHGGSDRRSSVQQSSTPIIPVFPYPLHVDCDTFPLY